MQALLILGLPINVSEYIKVHTSMQAQMSNKKQTKKNCRSWFIFAHHAAIYSPTVFILPCQINTLMPLHRTLSLKQATASSVVTLLVLSVTVAARPHFSKTPRTRTVNSVPEPPFNSSSTKRNKWVRLKDMICGRWSGFRRNALPD